jgi:hypothetical protein
MSNVLLIQLSISGDLLQCHSLAGSSCSGGYYRSPTSRIPDTLALAAGEAPVNTMPLPVSARILQWIEYCTAAAVSMSSALSSKVILGANPCASCSRPAVGF